MKQGSLYACLCCRVAVVVSSANMELELVRQCVDRALVLDDRVSKFSVQLGEWPGDMAKLLDFLTREDVRWVNIHRCFHLLLNATVQFLSCISLHPLSLLYQVVGCLPSETR